MTEKLHNRLSEKVNFPKISNHNNHGKWRVRVLYRVCSKNLCGPCVTVTLGKTGRSSGRPTVGVSWPGPAQVAVFLPPGGTLCTCIKWAAAVQLWPVCRLFSGLLKESAGACQFCLSCWDSIFWTLTGGIAFTDQPFSSASAAALLMCLPCFRKVFFQWKIKFRWLAFMTFFLHCKLLVLAGILSFYFSALNLHHLLEFKSWWMGCCKYPIGQTVQARGTICIHNATCCTPRLPLQI